MSVELPGPEEETITITRKEYDELVNDMIWLRCLESAGVDNWDGFDEAREILKDYGG